jgi:hypothetical protein
MTTGQPVADAPSSADVGGRDAATGIGAIEAVEQALAVQMLRLEPLARHGWYARLLEATLKSQARLRQVKRRSHLAHLAPLRPHHAD